MFKRSSKPPQEPQPTRSERKEAAKFPNGHVYRIAKGYDPKGQVPAYAILGAWPVDAQGEITEPFKDNPNYDAEQVKTCPHRKT